MGKLMDKYAVLTINIIYILVLIMSIVPLLALGMYNFPSADDWSFAATTYQIVQDGGNLWDVFGGAWQVVQEYYQIWEGRFTIVLLSALQPAIWGEEFYQSTTWIMVMSLVIGQVVFAWSILKKSGNGNLLLPIVFPILVFQLLFVPYPDESLFWYNGSVNYTFMYFISLMFIAGAVHLAGEKRRTAIQCAEFAGLCIMAFFIGGGNFATSVATILLLVLLLIYWMVCNRTKSVWWLWALPTVEMIGLLVALLSPGRQIRIDSSFGGEIGNPIAAIMMSLLRTATNIYSWTDYKVIVLVALVFPFLWCAVSNMNKEWRWPGVFTLLSFGIYASMIVATMYVDSSTGGGRMGAILFYAYFVWLFTNLGYWIGWLQRCFSLERFTKFWGPRSLVVLCAMFGVCLLVVCGFNKERTTFYKAYRSLKQGWAQEYAREWEERLVLLHDENVDVVQVRLLDIYPEMIVYADLQKDENLWVNDACAMYYGKSRVEVVE